MATEKEKLIASSMKYLEKQQYDKAAKDLEKALALDDRDDRLYLRLGAIYERMDRKSDAVAVYLKTTDLYDKIGANTKALATLKQALRIAPNDFAILERTASLYNRRGQKREAFEIYTKLLENFDEGQHTDKYQSILESMLRVEAENSNLRLRYAKHLFKQGDTAGALKQYQLTLNLLLAREKYSDYVQAANTYLSINPDDLGVILTVAKIYAKSRHYTEALHVLRNSPGVLKSEEALGLMARCENGIGAVEEEVHSLKRLLDLRKLRGVRDEDNLDLWRHIRDIAPNDREAAKYVKDEEVPILGESSLGFLEEVSASSMISSEMWGKSEDFEARFREAEALISGGDDLGALRICYEVLDADANNIRALEMMTGIFRRASQHARFAESKRKLARLLIESDREAAVAHLREAQEMSPGTENMLMCSELGIDISMIVPSSAPATKQNVEAVRRSATPTRKMPPPPPIPPITISKPSSSDVSNLMSETPQHGIVRHKARDNSSLPNASPIAPPPGRLRSRVDKNALSGSPVALTGVYPLPNDLIDDIRVIEPGKTAAEQTKESIDDDLLLNNELAALNDDDFDNLFNDIMEPVSVVKASHTSSVSGTRASLSGVPVLNRAQRDKLDEALKEIDFYLSLHLAEDAERLIRSVICDYGELPEITERKNQLDSSF